MAHDLGADLHEFFPQAGQRPLLDRLRHQGGHAARAEPDPFSAIAPLFAVSAIFLDSVLAKAQRNNNRDANAKRSSFQSNLSTETLLSVPFPRSEACQAKGNHMRTLVEPPPSSHCHLCGGELRLKLIESANRGLDLDNEVIVCIKCGRELSCTVSHNHSARHMPDPKAA